MGDINTHLIQDSWDSQSVCLLKRILISLAILARLTYVLNTENCQTSGSKKFPFQWNDLDQL